MKRTNTFEVVPQFDADEELLRRLLDASAALWNEINYERRQHYADPDGDVWDISEYRGRYGGVLGASTVQQIDRKNREAWRSFFALQKRARPTASPASGATNAKDAPFGRTSATHRTRSNGANTLVSKSSSGAT